MSALNELQKQIEIKRHREAIKNLTKTQDPTKMNLPNYKATMSKFDALESLENKAEAIRPGVKAAKNKRPFLTSQMASTQLDKLEAENSKLATENASLKSRLAAKTAPAKPAPVRPTASKPAPGANLTGLAKATAIHKATTTASSYGKQSPCISRSEFAKLSSSDKSRFSKDGGTII